MNKVVVGIIGLLILVGGFFVFNQYIYQAKQAEAPTAGDDVGETPEYRELTLEGGLTFQYKTAPDGYVLDDVSEFIGEEDAEAVLAVYRLMNEREKIELENSEGGREGPPTINIMIHQNPLNQSASVWVDDNSRFSAIEMLIGEADRDAVIGGANAVRYTTDGLYRTDNAVVAHGGYVYHFMGSYHEADSVIHQDFVALLNSVTFEPTAEQMGGSGAKIDPRVACESALAFMLFESGEKADEFVEECVNGEHPDVIQNYIDNLGVDGAAI